MSEIKNIFDSLDDCNKWFKILEKRGYNGFSILEMNGKWHCMAHRYEN